MWHQNRISLFLLGQICFLYIICFDSSADCVIYCSCLIQGTMCGRKNKAGISINLLLTKAKAFLNLILCKKGIKYFIKHRNQSGTCSCLRCLNMSLAFSMFSLAHRSVGQVVIHTDETIFKVYILPAKSKTFTDTHPCSK